MAPTVAAVDDLEKKFPGAVLPAFEIRAGGPISEVGAFAQRFKTHRTVVIHRNHSHSLVDLKSELAHLAQPPVQVLLDGGAPLPVFTGLPAAGRVLLRDGFRRLARNADYPAKSNFDDLLYTYSSLGFDGFGDFATIGDRYSPTGGAALHVALHLTEPADGPTIIANHFVSTTPPHKGDVQGKYFSALSRAIKHTGSRPNVPFDTEGVSEYSASHRNRQFSGLGKPIQWSTMHHMELIDRELSVANSQLFI
jgi:hypothetical protein